MSDFKDIVVNTYPHIIHGTFNRIIYFETDSILNNLIRLHVASIPRADEEMLITDKFFIFKGIWQGILETLYKKYLPNIKYDFKWDLEVSPYTLMLYELTKENFESTEIELLKKIINYNDNQIESDFKELADKIGLSTINLPNGIIDKVPGESVPKGNKDHLILLFRLMNFPPLEELARFQHRYNVNIKKQTERLSIAFSGIEPEKIPMFVTPEYLHYSYFHLDHATFKKYGLTTFENHPQLATHKEEFDEIRRTVDSNKDKFKDKILCPCCGEYQEIILPQELLEYKYLLENQALCKEIGLIYLQDFIESYKQNLSEKFYMFLPNINKVDNPDCIILVEGESEEASIPILAFRKRFILSQKNIQVYNSKSKEKLAADFLSMKANYPKRKIICLIDSDAKKERSDIERIIKNHQNQYRLVFINKGTYEDLFDIQMSVEILNEMYPEDEDITVEDFDSSKEFLSNVQRFLFVKKKAKFDKVLFAKTMSYKMDIDRLPKEIEEILKVADDFTRPTKYVKTK